MSTEHIPYDSNDYATKLADALVGRSITSADVNTGMLTLSDGSRVVIDTSNSECCSWLDLKALATTENIITAVEIGDDEDNPNAGPYSAYKAWIKGVTAAGVLNIAEAEGDYSNGYYLHGFALDVEVIPA